MKKNRKKRKHAKTVGKAENMKGKIYQIHLSLKYFEPKIWRRILVPADLSLAKFHKVIQITMGWSDSHLHQFFKSGIIYTPKPQNAFLGTGPKMVDYKKMKIYDLLNRENDKMFYLYDLGDDWKHDIILEKILPVDEQMEYPVCVDGENSCPPEDVGGIGGYAYMLEVLNNPNHEDFEQYDEWYGADFDPGHFDKDYVNMLLRGDDFKSM